MKTPQKRVRRLAAAAAIAAASALVLSACSVTGAPTSAGGAGDADSGTLNALFMKQAGYTEDDVKAMIEDFNEEYPDITVNPTFVAYEALHDKIVTSAPSGTYDVVLMDVIWPAEFASKGLVTDVTDRFPEEWEQDMLGGALITAEYQDKYYGVPWYPSTKLFYYNTEMVEQAGYSTSDLDTWDGVLEVAAAMKEQGIVKYPIAWSWAQAEALICDYAQLLGAFGGEFTNDDGELIINEGPGVEALSWMKQTIDDGLSNPNSTTFLEDDVNKTMASGQAAFSLNWESTFRDLNDESISQVVGQVGVSATPKGAEGTRPGVNGAMALGIASKSENKDAAWNFISFISSQSEQEKFVTSTLPNWKASYEDPEITETNPEVFAAAKVGYDDGILRPQVPNYSEVSQIIQAEIQNALLGKKSPQQAMDDAVAAANDVLND
ncbi:extracellular solute-binding protein [Paramicrobacterium agarici]|uniref:Carbohydrate ABC transporter substrate-binding protein (CUT1 family) n=1 Tax=Paramicrobacterium agarici TaxID=630514 RepID=A0A2A9E0B9_9MICO|nr:extracellular solute-binding protein [Microbacterium agarici]PFG32086.1 carbohydrate ABC transporter substrate-binding protein (CUT1 family) [Microbacterium agarici]TQO21979.1 carbohydrate ABC transporter substrate-binding protein (CUT1 family) [Microbacterium agarici]